MKLENGGVGRQDPDPIDVCADDVYSHRRRVGPKPRASACNHKRGGGRDRHVGPGCGRPRNVDRGGLVDGERRRVAGQGWRIDGHFTDLRVDPRASLEGLGKRGGLEPVPCGIGGRLNRGCAENGPARCPADLQIDQPHLTKRGRFRDVDLEGGRNARRRAGLVDRQVDALGHDCGRARRSVIRRGQRNGAEN